MEYKRLETLGKKLIKFVSIHETMEEFNKTLMRISDLKEREEIGPLIENFGKFEVRKDAIKSYHYSKLF